MLGVYFILLQKSQFAWFAEGEWGGIGKDVAQGEDKIEFVKNGFCPTPLTQDVTAAGVTF